MLEIADEAVPWITRKVAGPFIQEQLPDSVAAIGRVGGARHGCHA
jgi:hypothetical protein